MAWCLVKHRETLPYVIRNLCLIVKQNYLIILQSLQIHNVEPVVTYMWSEYEAKGKSKVIPVLNWAPRLKTYWEVGV
jgi:hypothetical protein